MKMSEPPKTGYRSGGLSNTKIPKGGGSGGGKKVKETRMNDGGDTNWRGRRGHMGKTSKGKGMNKNAY